jgi:hypothetical protein
MCQFKLQQQVSFVGGKGKIQFCHKESGTWLYAVEMPLAETSNVGRIGNETTIILYEEELEAESQFNSTKKLKFAA